MSAGSLARRSASASCFTSGRLSAAVLAALFVFLLPAAADAYTLVLRSGRQVTVPGDFRVTPSAVTYEASPGFSVTVWLANVDVAATERVNAEPAGSFFRRISRGPDGRAAGPTTQAAKAGRRAEARVITDKDLEPQRLRREAQEAEYERTRRERGMPSKKELQRRIEEQDRRLRELAREMQEARAEAELESLRSELVNVRRELNELDSRLSRQAGAYALTYASPSYYPYYYTPPAVIIDRFPFGRGGFGRGHFLPHPYGRGRPHSPWRGFTFGGSTVNGGTPPVMAPALSVPRR
jgi:hypothetical protein